MTGVLHGVLMAMSQPGLFDVPDNGGYEDLNAAGGGNSISLKMDNNGTWSIDGGFNGNIETGSWVTPNGLAPGSYHVRMEEDSGAFTSGAAVDTDLPLTSDRTWTLTVGGGGDDTVSYTIYVKDASGGNILAQGSGSVRAASV